MRQNAVDNLTIVILAGGMATRFPGKLEADTGGIPLLERVYQNLRGGARIVIAGSGTFSPQLDAQLDCPIVVDRWPARGPLGGVLSSCCEVRSTRIFAVAGDAPNVTKAVLYALLAAWHDGDEALVPVHDGRREPLAALYDREAVMREGYDILHYGDASMYALLERLRTREIPLQSTYFTNVNTPADLV